MNNSRRDIQNQFDRTESVRTKTLTISFGKDRKMKKLILTAALVVLMSLCSVSSAGLRVFHNQTDFLNSTGPLSFEGFEGLTANNSNSLSSITAPGFVVTAPNAGLGIFNTTISGQSATEGTHFLDHQSDSSVTTTFTFNSKINSFGFDLIDYGDFGAGQLTLMNDVGDNVVVAVAGGLDGNVQYFGLISDFTFTKAIFTNTISGEAFGFDRVSYGVPEPATLLLLGLGAAMLRRKHQKF
jgi:hypothetical protein